MEEATENEKVYLIYAKNSNLKPTIQETERILTEKGFQVEEYGEDYNISGENDHFRIYFFNKGFKKYQLLRLQRDLNDSLITPDNAMILCRKPHFDDELDSLLRKGFNIRLLQEITDAGEAEKEILAFVWEKKVLKKKRGMITHDSELKKVKNAIDDVDFGRPYILVSNLKGPVSKNAECLAAFPWIKVFDLSDNTENRGGLLNVVRDCLLPVRCTISSSSDLPSKPKSEYTSWTIWGEQYDEELLFDYRNMLEEYCHGLKAPTILLLWYPENDELIDVACDLVSKLMHPFRDRDDACFLFITELTSVGSSKFDKVAKASQRVGVPLSIFFDWLEKEVADRTSAEHGRRVLPMYDVYGQQKTISLCKREFEQLSCWMDILTINDRDDEVLSPQDGRNFLQGDPITWTVIQDDRYCGRRRVTSEIITYVEEEHWNKDVSGVVTIRHHPYSGGTTVGRRVLWEMRKKVPCLSVREKITNTEVFKQMIRFIKRRTRLPILLLFDEPLKDIPRFSNKERVTILHVVRRYSSMENEKHTRGRFYLKEIDDLQDSKAILSVFERFAEPDSCNELKRAIDSGKKAYMYEYGLAAFKKNFRGIRRYVKGHLQNDGKYDSVPWKTVVEFLALAKHYGSKNQVPSQAFAKTLKQPRKKVTLQDLDYIGSQLIMKHSEGRVVSWSIRHAAVAREILKQRLSKNSSFPPVEILKLGLAEIDRVHLKVLAIKFIETLSDWVSESKQLTNRILDVFISRPNDIKYSALLEDVYEANYKEEILDTLIERFPKHVDFYLHLGRLYYRTLRFSDAEKVLLEAIRIHKLEPAVHRYSIGDVILMRIHHTLGTCYYANIQHLMNESDINDETMDQIRRLASQSIERFEMARNCFNDECNQTYGYLSEVQVRLQMIFIIVKKRNLIQEIAEHFGICDRLLAQCAERASQNQLRKGEFDKLVDQLLQIYQDLSPTLEEFSNNSDSPSSKICHLACLRHKFAESEQRFSVFSRNLREHDIIIMIKHLKEVINNPSAYEERVSTEMMEWIKLIRRLNHPPPLEDVLTMVKEWDNREGEHSLSAFYLYVIRVAMAICYEGKSMNEIPIANLSEKLRPYGASIPLKLQDDPREVLGDTQSCAISCLIHREKLEGNFDKNHEANKKRFRRCTGFISAIEDFHVIIHLELKEQLRRPIEVFCDRHPDNLKSRHVKQGGRMSFYVRFSPKRGAEAFDAVECESADGAAPQPM